MAGLLAMRIQSSLKKANPPHSHPNSWANTPRSNRLISNHTLAVRERAVHIIAQEDPYAAILISMHTYNLLTERADRSTIAVENLPLLDRFHRESAHYSGTTFVAAISTDKITSSAEAKSDQTILEHFRLLQACDNLSLLSCVAFSRPANLLHPLPLNGGGFSHVQVLPVAPRHFRLTPWPFAEPELIFHFPARHVDGKKFTSAAALDAAFSVAEVTKISVNLTQ